MALLVTQECTQTRKLIWHARCAEETSRSTQDAGERINLRSEAATTKKGGTVHRAATQRGYCATTKPEDRGIRCRLPLIRRAASSVATCPASASFPRSLPRGPYVTPGTAQTRRDGSPCKITGICEPRIGPPARRGDVFLRQSSVSSQPSRPGSIDLYSCLIPIPITHAISFYNKVAHAGLEAGSELHTDATP